MLRESTRGHKIDSQHDGVKFNLKINLKFKNEFNGFKKREVHFEDGIGKHKE